MPAARDRTPEQTGGGHDREGRWEEPDQQLGPRRSDRDRDPRAGLQGENALSQGRVEIRRSMIVRRQAAFLNCQK